MTTASFRPPSRRRSMLPPNGAFGVPAESNSSATERQMTTKEPTGTTASTFLSKGSGGIDPRIEDIDLNASTLSRSTTAEGHQGEQSSKRLGLGVHTGGGGASSDQLSSASSSAGHMQASSSGEDIAGAQQNGSTSASGSRRSFSGGIGGSVLAPGGPMGATTGGPGTTDQHSNANFGQHQYNQSAPVQQVEQFVQLQQPHPRIAPPSTSTTAQPMSTVLPITAPTPTPPLPPSASTATQPLLQANLQHQELHHFQPSHRVAGAPTSSSSALLLPPGGKAMNKVIPQDDNSASFYRGRNRDDRSARRKSMAEYESRGQLREPLVASRKMLSEEALRPPVPLPPAEPTIVPDLVSHSLKRTGRLAVAKIGDALGYIQECVQQGPEGVRTLTFVGGVCMLLYYAFSLINIFGIITNPFRYFMNLTFAFFGWVSVIWEASDDVLSEWRPLREYQAWIAEYCKCLAIPWCLGLLYVYVGCLQVMLNPFVSIEACLGFYFLLMGGFNLALHLGYDIEAPTRLVGTQIRAGAGWLREKVRGFSGETEEEEKDARGSYFGLF
ncbi:unnamed protein product [Amoebophrya sp. A25]|nr:unnamed protein product [Amoebophrya sp. A25]|eukprot:GSA25T00000724001.1